MTWKRSYVMTACGRFSRTILGYAAFITLFVPFVIGVFILIPKKSIKINYFDISVVCYILITIIAGWARGDNLYESFGDSGNRIMIQAVPVILFALIVKVTEGLKYWKEENLG